MNHQHDCAVCVYVGSEVWGEPQDWDESEVWGEPHDWGKLHDFYYHPDENGLPKTFIARSGPDGEYLSGTCFILGDQRINAAFRLAEKHFKDNFPHLIDAFRAKVKKEGGRTISEAGNVTYIPMWLLH